MAQSTSTTPSINSTNGITRENEPVNKDNTVRATADVKLIGVDSRDKNQYPVVNIVINTGTSQFWFYALGDEATRDADLATF